MPPALAEETHLLGWHDYTIPGPSEKIPLLESAWDGTTRAAKNGAPGTAGSVQKPGPVCARLLTPAPLTTALQDHYV